MIEVRAQKEGNNIFVYAYEGSQPVGFAIGAVENNAVELETIHVDACRRGNGIGSSLLTTFINQARSERARSLTGEMKPEFGLNVDKTASFYQKHGVRVDGEKLTMDFKKEF